MDKYNVIAMFGRFCFVATQRDELQLQLQRCIAGVGVGRHTFNVTVLNQW